MDVPKMAQIALKGAHEMVPILPTQEPILITLLQSHKTILILQLCNGKLN